MVDECSEYVVDRSLLYMILICLVGEKIVYFHLSG